MNKRLLLAVTLLIALPLHADFGSIERTLHSRLGAQRWIPFLGVARFASNVIHPRGVHDFQLAVFERGRFDGQEGAMIMSRQAAGFTQLVKSRTRDGWTFVYCRPASTGRVEVLILTTDAKETVLVRCDVDPHAMAESMGKPKKLAAMGR